MGEVNKGAVALIVVLLFGAAGYLWFSFMYKPAVEARDAAVATQSTAQADLQAAQTELAAAQQRVEESKQELSKADDSVSRVQVARKAVPNGRFVDDAAIVLMDLAERSGIETGFKATTEDGTSAGADTGGLQGATPIDLEFEAVGTYDEMMLFMRLVEGTVERRDGQLFTRDRLFNVVKLEIGGEGSGSSSGDQSAAFLGGGSESSEEELTPGPGELKFTVTVRMYSSTTENAQGVGAATPDDPAAAGTDPNAVAAGTDPNAAAGTDPNAAGGAPAVVDPAAPAAAAAGGGI